MPRALSTALRALIKTDLEANLPIKEIMAKHRISQKKASSMYILYHQTGEVYLPPTIKKHHHGRPRKIKPAHEERLRAFLAEHPDAYISNMCDFLAAECGVHISESGVSRFCKELGHKIKRRPDGERGGPGFRMRTLPRDENGRPVRPSKSTSDYKKKGPTDRPGRAQMMKLLEKTRGWVKEYLSSSGKFDAGHDWAHVERVVALSMEILRVEEKTWKRKGVRFDALVVELVALMHDIDEHRFAPGASPQSTDENEAATTPATQDPDQTENQTHTQSYPSPDSTTDPSPLPPSPPSLVHTTLTTLGWPPSLSTHISHLTRSIPYTTEFSPLPAAHTLHTTSLNLHPEHAIVQDAIRLDMLGAIGISRAIASHGMDKGVAFLKERLGKVEKGMKTGEGGSDCFVERHAVQEDV
ncbi:hypothetical protein JMJ35_009508 [Cladonia borealis]|uniref:HD/PDEase domain-containing protein n=1 Tax=Cladonia borealis TaxID=184061 RepID=A0AA39V2B1_9LECA|nr:hypothetical protein JMJ35_009508 [Cladonia borealis]